MNVFAKTFIREGKKLLVENKAEIENIFSETIDKIEKQPGENKICALLFQTPNGAVNYSLVSIGDAGEIVRVIETKPLYEFLISLIEQALKQ